MLRCWRITGGVFLTSSKACLLVINLFSGGPAFGDNDS